LKGTIKPEILVKKTLTNKLKDNFIDKRSKSIRQKERDQYVKFRVLPSQIALGFVESIELLQCSAKVVGHLKHGLQCTK